MTKFTGWARRHKSALLLLMFLSVAAPFSPPFFKMVAGSGFTFSTQTVYPGGSFTVTLPDIGPGAGSYPTSGQISTFTIDQFGRITAAGSTTTLTAPAISSPVLSGTASGTYVLGGTPSLGADLVATSFSVTGLSQSPGTFQAGVRASITGSTTYYLSGVGSSTALTSQQTIYMAASSRTIKNCAFWMNATAGSTIFTVQYYNGSWNDSTITCTASNGGSCIDSTHTRAITGGQNVAVKAVTSAGVTIGTGELAGFCEVVP